MKIEVLPDADSVAHKAAKIIAEEAGALSRSGGVSSLP